MMASVKGTAVVTGASSGIGAIYADRLARRGYDLLLVARRRRRLDGLAKYLKDTTGRSIEVVAADLNDAVDLASIETILREGADIRMLVNNAGVGATGSLLSSPSTSTVNSAVMKPVAPGPRSSPGPERSNSLGNSANTLGG